MKFLIKHRFLLTFFVIMLIGLYLRFYKVEVTQSFDWDQAKESWKTRDVLMGQLVLEGPRTGVGRFHLGPLWYYLLSPFYYITKLDPMGANYLNFLINIFNFIVFYLITRKIFNEYAALFSILILAVSKYLIEITRTPWYISPVFVVSTIIFYSIYKIVYKNNYKWIPLLAFLTGLFTHLHFSVVFLIPIILLSFLFVKHKKTVFIKGLISLPLFLIWFIPIILFNLQTKNGDLSLFQNFSKDYLISGFHLRFFLYRLNDAFIQFHTILSLPPGYPFLEFIIPLIFAIVLFFEKDKKKRLLGYLMSLWFIVPAIMYSFYGGTTSEYYVLINAPLVIYILYYLQEKLLNLRFKPVIIFLLVGILSFYIYYNTFNLWIKPNNGGLAQQKDETRKRIKRGEKIPYNEGDIKAYLYQIWVIDKKPGLN